MIPVIEISLEDIKTELREYFDVSLPSDVGIQNDIIDEIVEQLHDDIIEQLDINIMLNDSMKYILKNRGLVN